MKITLVVLLVVLCISTYVHGAAQIIKNTQRKEHPGQCYYEGPPRAIVNRGKTQPIKNGCGIVACDKDYTVTVTTCGIISPPPKCKIVKDEKKPYPDCCGKVVCP